MILRVSSALLCAYLAAPAAPLLFTGTFTSDGDVASFNLNLASNSLINIRSLSYGGWNTPPVTAGGFAVSLALYDQVTGALQANDFVGGTAVGPNCSNGAQKDPVTGFCEDATISFSANAGNYVLLLTVQGNNGPSNLGDPLALTPGSNFPGGPFVDPGDITGSTIRNGNWATLFDIDGTVTSSSAVPEPSTSLLLGAALTALAWRRRR